MMERGWGVDSEDADGRDKKVEALAVMGGSRERKRRMSDRDGGKEMKLNFFFFFFLAALVSIRKLDARLTLPLS
jgi:hypothetical protein